MITDKNSRFLSDIHGHVHNCSLWVKKALITRVEEFLTRKVELYHYFFVILRTDQGKLLSKFRDRKEL